MKVAVCAKLVPGPGAPQGFDPVTHNLLRAGELVLDDADTYGVEVALRLAEQAGGGEVTLVTMAPVDAGGAATGLRTALAMGASGALVASDEALAGSDALGTAKVLAALARRAGAELVVAATESTDGYTGTVPVQLAELLGLPAVTYAKHVEAEGGALKVVRQTELGSEEVTCPLPAVVTVTAGVVEVRYPSLRGIMAAKAKPVEVLSLRDLGLSPEAVGKRGGRQEVVSLEEAEVKKGGRLVADDGGAHEEILEQLATWGVL